MPDEKEIESAWTKDIRVELKSGNEVKLDRDEISESDISTKRVFLYCNSIIKDASKIYVEAIGVEEFKNYPSGKGYSTGVYDITNIENEENQTEIKAEREEG